MLNRLTIDGLQGVGRTELKFEGAHRVATLFGQNGIGKTKCLEALFQFLLFSNKTFLGELARHGIESEFSVMRRAEDQDGNVYEVKPRTPMHLNGVWSSGQAGFHDLPVVFLGANSRSLMTNEESRGSLLGSASERRQKYLEGLLAALRTHSLGSLGMAANVQSWFVVRAQSVNPYQKESDNRQVEINAVLELLSSIDSRIDSSFLQVDGAGRVAIKIENDVRLLSQLSSGFISLVKLMQAIVAGYAGFTNEINIRHVKGVVLIDEIESHLHAAWQVKIIPKLKELLPNTTFYVATHSPLVLAQLEEGEAYLLTRGDDGVVRSSTIDSPSRRAFADVLESALGIDLNAIKRSAMERDDQSAAKQALLQLLQGEDRE